MYLAKIKKRPYGRFLSFNKRITGLSFGFTGRTKETTRTARRIFDPFVSAEVNTFGQGAVGGGIFINNFGLQAKYIYDFRYSKSAIGVGIQIKF